MPHGDEYTKLVRLEDSQRDALLNRMDHSHDGRRNGKRTANRRRDQRWSFRSSDIALQVEHPGGGISRLLVVARNLSAGGMSFLHGGFLHPGSTCRGMLRRNDGRTIAIEGKVASCRLVEKTIHEVGLKFDKRIEPSQFVKVNRDEPNAGEQSQELGSLDGKVLCIDPSAADLNLLRFYLEGAGAQVQTAANGTEGIAMALQGGWIAITIELMLSDQPGQDVVKSLRTAGLTAPIVALTADDSDQARQSAMASGCDAVMTKPIDSVELSRALCRVIQSKGGGEAIVSTQWQDARMRPLILSFLTELEQEVHRLQELVAAADAVGVRKACLALKGSAGGYGYPQISEAAQDLIKRLGQTPSLDDLKGQIDHLTALCASASRAKHSEQENSPQSSDPA